MRISRNRYLFALDAILVGSAPFVAYALRFEGFAWADVHVVTARIFAAASLAASMAIFFAFGLYRRLWRYASVFELQLIFVAGAVSAAASAMLGLWLLPRWHVTPVRVPLSVVFGVAMLNVAIIATSRLSIRISSWRRLSRPAGSRRVLIAGAGAAGEMVVKELRLNPELGMEPIGFVDDDVTKHGMRLANLPVLGPLSALSDIVRRQGVAEILIAMPRAAGPVVRQIVRVAFEAGIPTRTVPGLFEILSERVKVTAIREVQIEDLLRRDTIQTDLAVVARLAERRTVLVTGAGGSIGSELCRQIAVLAPKKLVCVGHGENPIFDITGELRRLGVACEVVPVIADIRDRRRIRQVLETHQPFAVFHAAAHKHVPLMEGNVVEAITNNVMGTRNLVEAAVIAGVQHFVLISTDKAVRPTNVMGASKRVAEFIVHNAAIKNGRNFVAVRFGNVLGSQGSVIPTFRRQIREGGPVCVTHPAMKRYFMTIPEAVQLVLQAGALGKGGELFMLDMGEPVRVLDLARDMIRLSGLQEGTDIEIAFTGIRPGEKLYEEMFFGHEVAVPTEHPKILRARGGVEQYCSDTMIAQLVDAALAGSDENQLRLMLQQLVPDFTNDGARIETPAIADRVEPADLPSMQRVSGGRIQIDVSAA